VILNDRDIDNAIGENAMTSEECEESTGKTFERGLRYVKLNEFS
jgi:hypothetical protein